MLEETGAPLPVLVTTSVLVLLATWLWRRLAAAEARASAAEARACAAEAKAKLAALDTQGTFPRAVWGASHSSYGSKIRGGAITAGTGFWRWATGAGTLPEQGKYRIQYRVDRIGTTDYSDICVGVASRAARVEDKYSDTPKGCYCWLSYRGGRGSGLSADGSVVQGGIPQESRAGSTIEIIVDQDASTVVFRLDSAPVGKGGTACKLTIKPEHKRDLTPAASVYYSGSALTLVAVEAVAR
eukprot:gene6438-209_t